MRIGWLLLFFPSLAFAIGGCPVGVQLGMVTIATRLPVCLKFESSEFGGCLVDCKNVCVELPLANTKGPVETTGTSCNYSDNGSGNGDSDGSGNTPDQGNSGTKPISGWLDFEPVIGDATGTSVSGAVAKLNKNLGVALRQVVDSVSHDTSNLNLIAHSTESFSRDMKTSLYHLDRMSSDLFKINNTISPILGNTNTVNDYLQSINLKMDKFSGSTSGATGTGGNLSKEFEDRLFGSLDSMRYGSLNNIDFKMDGVKGHLAAIEGILGRYGMTPTLNSMNASLIDINAKMGSGGGSTGGGSTGNGSGDGIDYSKMPGTEDNPMSVKSSSYKSACTGEDCFFDVAGIQKQLDAANDSLKEKYSDIGNEVKEVFNFQLSGSAGVIDCFDLFSYAGKEYQVCPPSKDYWQTLAALMMFIFYFMALMLIFKR
ncbi:MAG: hypothetical protein ACRC8B_10490 [Aeromonas sobria]|uniref:hypothetical protein n=1 Tax=Aeromonas sobria TaxID=646 RepID=UPI003F32F21A